MKTQNFQIVLDMRSEAPIYVQIVEQVRQRVANGELRPGDQLPTVRQMATDLRVNFNTVARAYRLLDEAGLISTQQGRGTYIWETPPPEAAEKLRRENLGALTRRYLFDSDRLGFKPEEVVKEFEQQLASWKAGQKLEKEE